MENNFNPQESDNQEINNTIETPTTENVVVTQESSSVPFESDDYSTPKKSSKAKKVVCGVIAGVVAIGVVGTVLAKTTNLFKSDTEIVLDATANTFGDYSNIENSLLYKVFDPKTSELLQSGDFTLGLSASLNDGDEIPAMAKGIGGEIILNSDSTNKELGVSVNGTYNGINIDALKGYVDLDDLYAVLGVPFGTDETFFVDIKELLEKSGTKFDLDELKNEFATSNKLYSQIFELGKEALNSVSDSVKFEKDGTKTIADRDCTVYKYVVDGDEFANVSQNVADSVFNNKNFDEIVNASSELAGQSADIDLDTIQKEVETGIEQVADNMKSKNIEGIVTAYVDGNKLVGLEFGSSTSNAVVTITFKGEDNPADNVEFRINTGISNVVMNDITEKDGDKVHNSKEMYIEGYEDFKYLIDTDYNVASGKFEGTASYTGATQYGPASFAFNGTITNDDGELDLSFDNLVAKSYDNKVLADIALGIKVQKLQGVEAMDKDSAIDIINNPTEALKALSNIKEKLESLLGINL